MLVISRKTSHSMLQPLYRLIYGISQFVSKNHITNYMESTYAPIVKHSQIILSYSSNFIRIMLACFYVQKCCIIKINLPLFAATAIKTLAHDFRSLVIKRIFIIIIVNEKFPLYASNAIKRSAPVLHSTDMKNVFILHCLVVLVSSKLPSYAIAAVKALPHDSRSYDMNSGSISS